MNEELILQELQDIKLDVKEIKECLYVGNGKPSVCERISTLEYFQSTAKNLIWIVVGCVLTLATAATAAIVFHIKL